MKTTNVQQKRSRDYGLTVGFLPTGKRNSIADVASVTVGHKTLQNGNDLNTGVTVIDPGVKDLFRNKLQAAISVGNGYGKLAGYTQVEELGTLEAPIAITNTLAVGPVVRGVIDIVLAQKHSPKLDAFESVNVVVGETNDGYVNAIHRDIVSKRHAKDAYDARTKDFAFGNVGGGTGTRAFSWKGGIGSSSRIVRIGGKGSAKKYTVGVLIQTNFGGALTMLGVPLGKAFGKTDFTSFLPKDAGDGSCMIVIATDAPLTSKELKRVANRAFMGLARTGSIMAPRSGDYAVAFSACTDKTKFNSFDDSDLAPFFLATVEAVEESVYEALCAGKTVKGRAGNTFEKFPMEEAARIIKQTVGQTTSNK